MDEKVWKERDLCLKQREPEDFIPEKEWKSSTKYEASKLRRLYADLYSVHERWRKCHPDYSVSSHTRCDRNCDYLPSRFSGDVYVCGQHGRVHWCSERHCSFMELTDVSKVCILTHKNYLLDPVLPFEYEQTFLRPRQNIYASERRATQKDLRRKRKIESMNSSYVVANDDDNVFHELITREAYRREFTRLWEKLSFRDPPLPVDRDPVRDRESITRLVTGCEAMRDFLICDPTKVTKEDIKWLNDRTVFCLLIIYNGKHGKFDELPNLPSYRYLPDLKIIEKYVPECKRKRYGNANKWFHRCYFSHKRTRADDEPTQGIRVAQSSER